VFNKLGGLTFLLKCNCIPERIPAKLARFHQQALNGLHNFSPHKAILWNNSDISVRNKSLFYPSWHGRNIDFVLDVFDNV
jgi:hypothetical protein